MSDTPGGKLAELAKKNKPLVAVGVVGGALFLMKKGGGGGSGTVQDPSTAGGYVQLVPVSAPPTEGSDGTGDGSVVFNPGDPIPGTDGGTTTTDPTTPPVDTGGNIPPADTPATPDTPSPAAGKAAGAAQGAGVTIAGRFFPGATHASVVGSGKDNAGTYVIHLLYFSGHTERWYHYANNTWKGPIASNAAATPTATSSTPAAQSPAVNPAPPTTVQTQGPPDPNAVHTSGSTMVDPGWVNGNPGWPNPFLQYGAEYKRVGTGKTGHGDYIAFQVRGRTSPNGPFGPAVTVHQYTSGDWRGTWHQP